MFEVSVDSKVGGSGFLKSLCLVCNWQTPFTAPFSHASNMMVLSLQLITGTSAPTRITTQTGHDTVFISSEANQNPSNARTVDHLLGWLDYMEENLEVYVGTGEHRLLMSDEKSLIAKGPATLTNESLTNLHDDLGDIFFYTSGDLAWSAGVDLWLGKGDDDLSVLSVPSNPDSPPFRTYTSVHAGDGNDTINIALNTDDHDGVVFVANGQAGNDNINASLSSHPVILFGERGSDTLVGGSGNDIIFGDLGRVIWKENVDEIIVRRATKRTRRLDTHDWFLQHHDGDACTEGDIAAQVGGGGYGDFSDGRIRTVSEIVSLYTEVGGDDTIETGDGDNVAFGGFGSDMIIGGNQRDILVRYLCVCERVHAFNMATDSRHLFRLPSIVW